MKSIPSILFVCMGNICRSPSAEIIWHSKLSELVGKEEFACDSAGTIAYHAGEAPDQRMQAALQKAGYCPFGRARSVTSEDLDQFDLILAMDEDNLQKIRQRFGNRPEVDQKVHLFCEFTGIRNAREVPDPYYGGPEGFKHVIELIETGCDNLISNLEISKTS